MALVVSLFFFHHLCQFDAENTFCACQGGLRFLEISCRVSKIALIPPQISKKIAHIVAKIGGLFV